jgi:hypothetical protein
MVLKPHVKTEALKYVTHIIVLPAAGYALPAAQQMQTAKPLISVI